MIAGFFLSRFLSKEIVLEVYPGNIAAYIY